MKALLKDLPRLFDDRDKNVRGEAKNVTVEIYRWLGASCKTLFNELKPVVVRRSAVPLRYVPVFDPGDRTECYFG